MKFCPKHWEQLTAAVYARGLGHLIAANGRDAAARTAAELRGAAEPDDFDPLLQATWMIYGKASQLFGLYLLTGDYCPVCEAVAVHPTPCPHGCLADEYERWWIDGPAGAVLARAQELGIATPVEAPR